MSSKITFDAGSEYCGTSYAAKMLDLSVGTVQSLVEKGELVAWKTQGGHRRISIQSVRDFQRRNNYITKSHLVSGQRLKVMVVEDEDLTRQMLSDHFQQWDLPLDPSFFSSAMTALLDWPQLQPQVLITDLRMPGLDGFELIRTLHDHPRYAQMVVVVVTALSPQQIAAGGYARWCSIDAQTHRHGLAQGLFECLGQHGANGQATGRIGAHARHVKRRRAVGRAGGFTHGPDGKAFYAWGLFTLSLSCH